MEKRALLQSNFPCSYCFNSYFRYDAIVEADNLVKPDSDRKTVREKKSNIFVTFCAIDVDTDKITKK